MCGGIFPARGLRHVQRPFEPDTTVGGLEGYVCREVIRQLHVGAVMEGAFRDQLDVILNARSVSVCQTRA
jgi:hypothetical protein